MALPLWSPADNGHRGGRPWRPRLSDAVSMMPKNDWFHGSGQCSLTARGEILPHLGEETLAGCEMLLNKVIPRVTVRPVTRHLPPPRHWGIYSPCATYGEYRAWIYPLFEMGVWLRLCLPLCEVVENLQTTMSWFEKENAQAKISKDTLQSMDVGCVLTVSSLMPLHSKWSFWLHRSFFSLDTSSAKCSKQAPHFQVWLMSSLVCGKAQPVSLMSVLLVGLVSINDKASDVTQQQQLLHSLTLTRSMFFTKWL